MFRHEAIAHQQDRLLGGVLVGKSSRHRLLVALSMFAALAIVVFGLWGQYTRKEHVVGYLAPSTGLIKLFTPQAGTVVSLKVAEGQSVRQGDVLLVLSSERASTGTPDAQAAVQRELQQRRDSLRRERVKQAEIDALTGAALVQRIRSLESQSGQSGTQLEWQRSRITSAERTVSRNEALVAAQFLSQAALQQKQEELIDLRGQLAALQRSVSVLGSDLSTARSDLAANGLRRANNSAAIERQISELDQQLTEVESRRSVVLRAPADGTVTTLLTDVGQMAATGAPLLTILPAGAALEAQLLVPTRAAGFIQPGQAVALRYQAFPYQRFGHHAGQVLLVGRTVLQPNETSLPLTVQEPVYRVTVRLPAQEVRAYGQAMALRAGMLLDADVSIDRRRIVEWLFDPLLSVTGRV